MKMARLLVWTSLLAVGLGKAAAQGPNAETLSKEANAAYETKDWEKTAKLYGELSREIEYGRACVYAALKQPEKAFSALDSAVEQGYADSENLQSDPNPAALRSDARFAKIVEQANKNQRPCAYAAENRQFDFWLGEWEVSTTQGAVPAGNSKIDLILEDCVVQENWKSLSSMYAGKSYNIYNAALKRWE